MINTENAVNAAVTYLKTLPGELLGGPQDVRLESIDRSNGEWIVVLSYATDEDNNPSIPDNPLARALRALRRYKEFDIDAESGEVRRMIKPRAVQ